MRGEHGGVFSRVVGAAVVGGGEVVGDGLHQSVAGGDVRSAGGVEGLGDEDDGLFGLEEGLGGLCWGAVSLWFWCLRDGDWMFGGGGENGKGERNLLRGGERTGGRL